MYPLAMALLFAALCALANLAFPGPDIRGNAALARGHELLLICQAARDALQHQKETSETGPLSRAEVARLLPQGFKERLSEKSDWGLAQAGQDVIVYFQASEEGACFPSEAGTSRTIGVCQNGRLNDVVLPSVIPEGALVCVARGEGE